MEVSKNYEGSGKSKHGALNKNPDVFVLRCFRLMTVTLYAAWETGYVETTGQQLNHANAGLLNTPYKQLIKYSATAS